MVVRCNCDASCGENRYHDVGEAGCRYPDEAAYYAAYPKMKPSTEIVSNGNTLYSETRWGKYYVLLYGSKDGIVTKTKLLTIDPGKNISLQYHGYREETWFIVSGVGKLRLEKKVWNIVPKQTWHIGRGIIHQVKNTGTEPLNIIEIQEGTYCREDDIMRLQESWDESL